MQKSKPKTILVIDDDIETLNLMRKTLDSAGYHTLTESVGENVFHLLEENTVDLILLDIKMPGMDGHQLCSLLKGKQEYENIPVIFLTGLSDQHSVSKSFAVGAVDCITKPFNADELLARLNVYLHLREKNKELYVRKGSILACSNCGNVRDDKEWMTVANYLEEYSRAVINTKICPECDPKKEFSNSEVVTRKNKKEKQIEVLIIDDQLESLRVLWEILSQKDYKILAAESGINISEFIQKRQPDLILLDIMMPEMDGYQVCQEIKDNELTCDIPVLFLTAKAESKSILKGFEVGANDFIIKPFHLNEVLARVQAQLEFKRLRDKINQHKNSISVCDRCNKIKLHNENWLPFDRLYSTFGPSIMSYTVCPPCLNKKYKPL